MAPMRVIGVDGTKDGWVVAAVDDDGRVSLSLAATFSDVMRAANDVEAIAVDMPIGLCDTGGPRRADVSARLALGRARSRVFLVPPRDVVFTDDYPRALARARELQGSGISKQVFHLFRKIREVDAFVDDVRIHEVHPELSFMTMNKGSPVYASKKTWNGVTRRMRLLERAGLYIPDDVSALAAVPPDDVLDATALAMSARRIAQGCALLFPDDDGTERDRCGRAIVIRA
jgi:predicted RNase H-like nuclease